MFVVDEEFTLVGIYRGKVDVHFSVLTILDQDAINGYMTVAPTAGQLSFHSAPYVQTRTYSIENLKYGFDIRSEDARQRGFQNVQHEDVSELMQIFGGQQGRLLAVEKPDQTTISKEGETVRVLVMYRVLRMTNNDDGEFLFDHSNFAPFDCKKMRAN